jgi:hypothetical protein
MPQRALVSAPALRPAKNGLLDVANVIDPGDERWENGIAFTPRGCQAIFGHVANCPSDEKSPFWDCSPPFEAAAYLLEVGLQWSLVDLGADPKAILSQAMDVGTSAVLERLAWMGVAPVATGTPIVLPAMSGAIATGGIVGRDMAPPAGALPSGPQPTLVTSALALTDVATNPAHAIGLLEAKFLDASDHIGGGGTIFMSPSVAVRALGAFDPDRMITKATESQVVIGNFPPDQIIGVVGEVDVYLSDTFVIEAHEREFNEWVGRAERRAAVAWNCAVFSIDIP